MSGASFLFQEELFSAGGQTERPKGAMPRAPAQRIAPTIPRSGRSTLPARPLKNQSGAVKAASCCAENAAELRHARKRLRRERG